MTWLLIQSLGLAIAILKKGTARLLGEEGPAIDEIAKLHSLTAFSPFGSAVVVLNRLVALSGHLGRGLGCQIELYLDMAL